MLTNSPIGTANHDGVIIIKINNSIPPDMLNASFKSKISEFVLPYTVIISKRKVRTDKSNTQSQLSRFRSQR
uniref:Uncharacterized protein MANES_16G099600 n=1 Tax=Rhizophora mucronata TaxID=61149 RepID=A0A2P2MID7_RHIMU